MAWRHDFEQEAVQKGINPIVVQEAFSGITTPSEEVLKLDKAQPESTKTFPEYAAGVISPKRINAAREQWRSHANLFKQLEAQYGVPAPYLLALWGIESNFGEHQGNFSLIESLSTLAFDGRRSGFFRQELLNALIIMQQEHMSAGQMTGSWAGAMGQIQFMPSSYLKFAVDFDHDGKRDIWNDNADALASMANYLHQRGWNARNGWGIQVLLPPSDTDWADRKEVMPAQKWRALGVKQADGQNLPDDMPDAKLVIPDDDPDSAFLVFDNYSVIMDWNHSTFFATSVGLLADAIAKP